MSKIIKFPVKSKEQKFVDSLNEWQLDMFVDIITQVKEDYESLKEDYENKDIECLALKAELEIYKRGHVK